VPGPLWGTVDQIESEVARGYQARSETNGWGLKKRRRTREYCFSRRERGRGSLYSVQDGKDTLIGGAGNDRLI
jgi:Ca2+-binding RTX toxin-like protein